MTELPDPWPIRVLDILAWPVTIAIGIALFYRDIRKILSGVVHRVEAGAEVTTPWLSVGVVPTQLSVPETGEPITANHMALIHTSWRYPKKDAEFKKRVYGIQAIIRAEPAVLDRIEYVEYLLPSAWPNPKQVSTIRDSNFEFKELAWGEFTLRANVKVKGQPEPVQLSRYINLAETGPRL